MQARRCQGCAAPLPEGAEGEVVRCPFCGLLHDAGGTAAPRVQVHHVQVARPSRLPGWALALIAIIALGTLVPMLIGAFLAWKASSVAVDVARSATSARSPVASTATPAKTTSQLHDLTPGYHALQVAPPAGGYGAVDAVAALPWALAIAQAWQEDARLERIDVARLRPDGTVNVQDDGDATLTYRFVSPKARKALRDEARVRASAQAVVGFWVRVRNGAPQAYADAGQGRTVDDDHDWPRADSEALVRLMSRPAVQALRADLPFLNGYMIHLRDEGWVWYLSSLANESKPRVRARDGAVWPYPRRRS